MIYNADSHKWRLTMEGGINYINMYLRKFSSRETDESFYNRRALAYIPAYAKNAVIEIRNAFFARMYGVQRLVPEDYFAEGVDKIKTSLDYFLGSVVLTELLAMGRVVIWVDSPEEIPLGGKATPYLYMYRSEEIVGYDDPHNPTAIVLRDTVPVIDDRGLASSSRTVERHARLVNDTVVVTRDGIVATLDLTQLPVVILEMESILKDIADHQIALLNLANSDLSFCIKGNFPFYTEQYDVAADTILKQTDSSPNISTPIGVDVGRRYPRGLDRPDFIAPSTDPLLASMQKQEAIVMEMRRLVNLALTNLSPTRTSSESKKEDQSGMEAGLTGLAAILNQAEYKIASIWKEYTSSTDDIKIVYPKQFSLKTDEDRLIEANRYLDTMQKVPEPEIKRTLLTKAALILDAPITGIKDVTVFDTSIVALAKDLDNQLVSSATASKLRGYAPNEAEQALVDHADKLNRIAMAQSINKVNPLAPLEVEDDNSNTGTS